MYLLGMFVAQQFEKGAEQDDLDFFTFPEIDPTIGADAIEAPDRRAADVGQPQERSWRQGAARLCRRRRGAGPRGQVRPERDRHQQRRRLIGHTALQKKAVEFVASAKSIAQFMDRDTRPTSPPP